MGGIVVILGSGGSGVRSSEMPQDRAWLSPNQAAELLGLTPETIRRWIRRGELRAIKTGDAPSSPLRVPVSELHARMHVRPEPEQEEVPR
jgi:excisionase family DNA binding protein